MKHKGESEYNDVSGMIPGSRQELDQIDRIIRQKARKDEQK